MKKIAHWKMTAALAAFGLALALVLAGCPMDSQDNGGGQGVAGLTAEDISLASGTGAATPGELVGSGTTWSLMVAVANPGTVYVSIDRAGIAPGPQQLELFQGGTAIPAELVGRWHLSPIGFMYEFTADGRFIPVVGYTGQRNS